MAIVDIGVLFSNDEECLVTWCGLLVAQKFFVAQLSVAIYQTIKQNKQ